ncbi:MAG: hypothetical protein FWC75_04515 [Oscillospiraceae bacterium]|nr:hypothetical protein [Oscillospiraceae bacterium]
MAFFEKKDKSARPTPQQMGFRLLARVLASGYVIYLSASDLIAVRNNVLGDYSTLRTTLAIVFIAAALVFLALSIRDGIRGYKAGLFTGQYETPDAEDVEMQSEKEDAPEGEE